MSLKIYQQNTITKIEEFFLQYKKKLNDLDSLKINYPDLASSFSNDDISNNIFTQITGCGYFSYKNQSGSFYPNLTIKAPTGAGKTIIALETMVRYFKIVESDSRKGLVVWAVHREIIYTQTITRIRNKNDFYRQTLENYFGNNILIKEKGDPITQDELDNNLVILFVMLQSISVSKKERFKVFQDDGRYIMSIFPLDDEYAKHKELLENMPFLDHFGSADSLQPQVKTSLGNLIRLSKPLILIDEYHKFFTKIGFETLASLNPKMIIGYTATPVNKRGTGVNAFEANNNILVNITGKDLRDEEMIKYPINIENPPTDYSWIELLKDLKNKRDNLEKDAIKNLNNGGSYIRPIAVIQVENTGDDQRNKSSVHAEDAREKLIEFGVPPSHIAIKSSTTDELNKIELMSSECEIRYIITKFALQEGWDCPFAYILGLMPSTSSNTQLTQLIGRVLRQPYQSKISKDLTSSLDQCYIYYLKGNTQDTINLVKKGLEIEGLDQLEILTTGDGSKTVIETSNKAEITKIREDVINKYSNSLYLPIFWIKSESRKFSYELDIECNIDWVKCTFSEKFYDDLVKIFIEDRSRTHSVIDWDDEKHSFTTVKDKFGDNTVTYKSHDVLSISELQKRILEVIDLPFLSFKMANNIVKKLLSKEELKKGFDTNGTLIIKEIVKYINNYKDNQAKALFEKLLTEDKIYLAFGSQKDGGFQFNKTVNAANDNQDNKYLYEKHDFEKLNNFEENVKNVIFNHNNKLLWWYRNPESDTKMQKNFHIQGYRKYKIRPDFVISKIDISTPNNNLQMVYILESKGRMLDGNPDTEYKKYIFEKLTELATNGKTLILEDSIQNQVIEENINNLVQAHFIMQGNENSTINPLFKE